MSDEQYESAARDFYNALSEITRAESANLTSEQRKEQNDRMVREVGQASGEAVRRGELDISDSVAVQAFLLERFTWFILGEQS